MRLAAQIACFYIAIAMLLAPASGQDPVSDQDPASGQETKPKSSNAAIAQYGVAARYQKLEQYDLAAKEWEKLVADHPNDPLAAAGKHYAGICLFQLGQYQPAVKNFEQFVEKHPKHELLEQALTNLGLSQYNLAQAAEGDEGRKFYEQAAATFGVRQKKFPQGELAAESEFYRGESLYAIGKRAASAEVYASWLAAHADPSQKENHSLDAKVRLALGATQTELGEHAAAIATLTELLKRQPPADITPVATLRLGESLLADSQFSEAAKQFALVAAAEGFADADYALERQATALFQSNGFAEAAALYESLPTRFPQSTLAASSRESAGKCYYQAKQYQKAAELLGVASQAKPADMGLAHWSVRALLEAGDPKGALAAADRALASATDAQILLDKADALYEISERRSESVTAFIAAADASKDELAAEARHLAAATALELEQYAVAAKQAQQLIDAHPDSPYAIDARQTLAEARLQSGAPADAVAAYRELLKGANDQQRAEWSLRLAWALSASKDEASVAATLAPLAGKLTEQGQRQANYLLGRAWFRTGEFAKAIAPLQAVAKAQPPTEWSAESALLMARSQAGSGELPAAIASLDALIATSPDAAIAAQAYYRRGEFLQKNGDNKGAQEDYDQLTTNWPTSNLAPYADYRWARIAMNGDDPQGAAARFARLIASHPDHKLIAESRFAHATCLAQSGDHEQALAALGAMNSDDPRVALARGTSLVQTGKHEEAIAALQKATAAEFADRDRAWYELAWAHREAKQPVKAREAFEQLVKQFPKSSLSADASYRIGKSHYDAGEFAKAVDPFRASATSANAAPTLQEKALHLAAWSLLKSGDAASAAGEFAQQLTQHPTSTLAPDAKWLIGESYFKAGSHAEALAAYAAAKEAVPSSADLAPLGMLHAGQAAGQLEKWQESADWLKLATDKFPEYAGRSEVDFELARALYGLHKNSEAMPLFRKVAEGQTTPLGARARFMEGELLFAEKKYEEAVRSFFNVAYGYGEKKATAEYHPWQAESLFEAARCLEQLDRSGAARKIYAELVERFPKQPKAKLARERLKSL